MPGERQPRPQKPSDKSPLGKLRFRFHGLLGLSNFVLLAVVVLSRQAVKSLIALVVVGTALLALSSIPLLKQVPRQSVISRSIIPPHREAFQRTIAFVGYLNLRLAHQIGCFNLLQSWQDEVFAFVLGVYNLWFFLPTRAFDNGNTWVFVVPIWAGVSVDTWHQILLPFQQDSRWNEQVVTTSYLLLTLLVTLAVAFSFTLAFRKYIPIAVAYWAAAMCVGLLILGMLTKHSTAAF